MCAVIRKKGKSSASGGSWLCYWLCVDKQPPSLSTWVTREVCDACGRQQTPIENRWYFPALELHRLLLFGGKVLSAFPTCCLFGEARVDIAPPESQFIVHDGF